MRNKLWLKVMTQGVFEVSFILRYIWWNWLRPIGMKKHVETGAFQNGRKMHHLVIAKILTFQPCDCNIIDLQRNMDYAKHIPFNCNIAKRLVFYIGRMQPIRFQLNVPEFPIQISWPSRPIHSSWLSLNLTRCDVIKGHWRSKVIKIIHLKQRCVDRLARAFTLLFYC